MRTLNGSAIALPIEDEAAVAAQFEAIRAELAPTTALGAYFAGRVALAVVRSERAARHETKALAHRVRHAAADFDQQRLATAQSHRDHLNTDPHAARRALLTTPEGVDLLVEILHDLRAAVARAQPDWSAEHERILRDVCGWRDEELAPTRGFTLSRAILGDPRLLTELDRRLAQAPPIAPGLPSRLALALADLIAAEVVHLQAHRATLDHAAIACDRAEAADRALFDPGRESILTRRYEAASVRDLERSLRLFREAEASVSANNQSPRIQDDPGDLPRHLPTPTAGPIPTKSQSPEEKPAAAAEPAWIEPIEDSATITAKVFLNSGLEAVLGSFGSSGVGAG